MPIKAQGYLHYYFDDSGINPVFSKSEKTMNSYIDAQIKQFQARINTMKLQSGLTDNEFDSILTLLTSDEDGKKKEVYDKALEGFATNSGLTRNGKQVSYAGIGSMSAENIDTWLKEQASNICDSITIFQNQLNDYLDTAYQKLGKGSNFESYKRKVIIDYAITKKADSGIKSAIISDFLQHNGLNSLGLKKTSSGYETAIRNLTLLAYALPELVNFAGQSNSISYSTGESIKKGESRSITGDNKLPELFRVISAKIAGGFRNMTGIAGEMAWAEAESEGIDKVIEKLEQMNYAIDKLEGVSVIQSGSGTSKRAEGIRVSKGDVTVSIDSGGVKIQYGISVKNYQKPSTSSNIPHITISTYSNFYNLATKHGIGPAISPYNLVHYAASRTGKKGGTTTEAILDNSWKEIRQYVAIRNLLDILAGQGMEASDNVLILVVNGKVFTIDEILKAVKSKKNNISISTGGSVSRDSMKKNNVFIPNDDSDGNEDEAQERSKIAWSNTVSALQAAKLVVSLNNIAAMM